MPGAPQPPPEGPHWYCVRTKRLCERAAGAALREELSVEIFCPLVRFERARRTGKLWVTEALFPNYLFARLDYPLHYRRVRTTRGVLRIVGFGGCPAPVPAQVIRELREAVSEQEVVVLSSPVDVGGEIEVIAGPFRGLRTVVTRLLPAKERVAILLDILGTEREVEIDCSDILAERPHPLGSP